MNNIFSKTDMYLMSCTDTGKLRDMMALSPATRRKCQVNNMHLTRGIDFSEVNGFAILNSYNGSTDFPAYPYSMHNRLTGKCEALHFFEDDYKFAHATWERLEQTSYRLAKFECLFAPDFSLYVDAPIHLNKDSVYKSRFVGAFWQCTCGFNLIPTASWAGVDSFPWCFEGLPNRSVIAVCGVGVTHSSAAWELWVTGLHELERRLSPTLIVIYGGKVEVPGLHTPLQFIPDTITQFYRKKKK